MEIIATAISRALPGGSREVQPVNAEERQSAAVAIERAWRQRSWRTLLRRWRYCRTLAGNVQLHNPLDPAHASLMLVLQRPTPESATRMERHRDAFFRLLIRHPGIANVYTWMSLGSVVELKVVTLWLGAYHPVSDASCESPHPSNEPSGPLSASADPPPPPAADMVMMVIFAYNFVVSSPWRLANLHHLYCSRHQNATGLDFYGRETKAIWFFIEPGLRSSITILNLLSTAVCRVHRPNRLSLGQPSHSPPRHAHASPPPAQGGVAVAALVFCTPREQKESDVGGYQMWNLVRGAAAPPTDDDRPRHPCRPSQVCNSVWFGTWGLSLLMQFRAERDLRHFRLGDSATADIRHWSKARDAHHATGLQTWRRVARWLCCCCESAACRLCCRCPDAVERRMLLRAIRIDRSVSSTVKDLKTHMESGEGSAVKSLV